jgi:hypothetical protein
MIYLVMVYDPPIKHPKKDEIEIAMIDIIAAVELYSECRCEQRYNSKRLGVNCPPRTLWEVERGLDSGVKRWRLAQELMVAYQLVSPTGKSKANDK